MAYDKVIDSAALDAQMTELADAIRAKAGTNSELEWVSGFKSAVESIQTGGGAPITEGYCTFIDYDGTVVAAWTAEELDAATELPPNPTHDGLIAQGWNWTLDDLKTLGRECVIGQMYITDDGKTRIYVHLEEGGNEPIMGFCLNGSVVIDWGDGSAPDTVTGTSTGIVYYSPKHTYTSPGDYVITMSVNGSIGFWGDSASDTYSALFRCASAADKWNAAYRNAVRKIELGSGVVGISQYAFSNLCAMESITIPRNITGFGEYAFQNCYSLSGIVIPDGASAINECTFYNAFSLSAAAVPKSVQRIDKQAFFECHALRKILIPDGISSISAQTFEGCSVLTEVSLPDGLTSIEKGAFYECTALRRIAIPESVNSFGQDTFYGCTALRHVNIPDGVQTIPYRMFYNCNALSEISIPQSVTTFESRVFRYCWTLCALDFPDGMIGSIGDYMFQNCFSLLSLTIPAGITDLKAYSLGSMSGLKKLTFRPAMPPNALNANVFKSLPADCVVEVPAASLDLYKDALNYSGIAAQMVGV